MNARIRLNLPGIGAVTVRPVSDDDEPLFREFLDHVTREDLRLRFFATMNRVSDKLIAQLTHPDPGRAVVLVAVEESTQHVIGVARLHVDANGESGEYAVLVRSALKGRGLGWTLMKLIIDKARAKRLERIQGYVLADNAIMLKICGELGFSVKRDPDDPEVRIVRLEFEKPPVAAS